LPEQDLIEEGHLMTLTGNWSYPTAVRFGAGRISELGDACSAAGISRPLLVTDRGLAGLPITGRAREIMAASGLGDALFANVDPNPNEINLAAGVAAYQAGGHDGVIAFGGGSGLDLGKMVAFMVGQTRPVWDFEDIGDWWTRANADAIAPIIAVPTTAGTGSEVGRASVITNSQTHVKKIIFHPKLLPSIVIADPELTVGMPKFITAGTGLDAFAHCVEAYSSPYYHPMSQAIALEGMRLVTTYLPRAYATPDDLEARAHMMSAAAMGATAFQKGLGAIHAMSHPVGAVFNTHHGTTNAVCMPAVLAFNADAIRGRFDQAAAYLGIDGGFDGFCEFVQQFNDSFAIPRNLTKMGVSADRLDDLVAMALEDPSCGGNPVELTADGLCGLFRACF
jgi:alcohol dehydrogenase class IV